MVDRLDGLGSILHEMRYNQDLMEFISFNLHNKTFNLFNNVGLQVVWHSLMSKQIMDFYKIVGKNEKFSFPKIFNLSRSQKHKINYIELEKDFDIFKLEYDSSQFETIRDKYLAHKDLVAPEIKSDLFTTKSMLAKANKLFAKLSNAYKRSNVKYSQTPKKDFKKIFDSIEDFEKLKAFLMVAEIKKRKTVKISELADALLIK